MTDPTQLVRELNADTIRERVDAIDRERAALLVLLRAARRSQQISTGATASAPKPPKFRKGARS